MASSLFTALVLFIFFWSTFPCTHSFSARIIHRDSPLSPLYNPNITKFDRINAAYRRTLTRAQYLSEKSGRLQKFRRFGSSKFVMGHVYPDTLEYIMSFHVGTPGQEVFGAIDTASSLIWFQCLPCINCYKQSLPIHDPSQSSSYVEISCLDKRCLLSGYRCKGSGVCAYQQSYVDDSYANGVLATETFRFIDYKALHFQTSFENITFGCSNDNTHNSRDAGKDKVMGIIGFSREPLSLPSQLHASTFSHCFTSHSRSNSYSLMHFGDNAILTGPRIPILIDPDEPASYYVTLDGISVDDVKLELPAGTSDVTKLGSILVDTGCSYTILKTQVHDALVAAVRGNLIFALDSNPGVGFQLCFFTSEPENILLKTPEITLHFSGGLDMKWSRAGTYIQYGNDEHRWCLAVVSDNEQMTFGNYQMLNFNMGYDIAQNFLSVDRRDTCDM